MWFAPSAEDWAKPCLVTWQRTWEDALAVSLETGKPILVCVNMDGEIASEHYAGIRYRQPDITVLYEPYVTVIASVYRHSPRDFDENGERILCPRFGSVTCGEHISIEPKLFDQFFENKRIAPRHIMVELDKVETYDVYYAWDTQSVFETIKRGIAERELTAHEPPRDDRSLEDRVGSRDVVDRIAVERAYATSDKSVRRRLVESAILNADAEPIGLLRLAVYDLDLDLNRLARRALARSSSEEAVDLIVESLRVPLDDLEREDLIGALERIGESSPKARTLAIVHRGIGTRSKLLDAEAWAGSAQAGYEASVDARGRDVSEERLEQQDQVLASRDAEAHLDLAEAFLTQARQAQALAASHRADREFARLLLRDARRAAELAEEFGARGWRVNALLALTAYDLDEREAAYARAEVAVKNMPPGASGVQGQTAVDVLRLFAESRRREIWRAVRRKRDWKSWSDALEGTGELLADVHAAYSVLAGHPLGTDTIVAEHHDFLLSIGATGPAAVALDDGLRRFPESWALHDRLRASLLREKGAAGLEAEYEARLRREGASPNLEWFAGYASLVAAEFERRAGKEEGALAAYDRALAHYDRAVAVNPESRESVDHYAALAIAGRARMAFERGDHELALAEILASFERNPEAAGSLDGLNITPVDTAKMLRSSLAAAGRGTLLASLDRALAQLDPEHLQLPAYERELPEADPE
jgi:tetratricopeptide (TPR) repeat protein